MGAENVSMGERLKTIRVRSACSQVVFAKKLSIPQNVLSMIETGYRLPTLEWILNAADKLGVDPHELDERLASTKIKPEGSSKKNPKAKS